MSISLLRQLLMKEAVKKSAGSSGIMTINKNIAADVDKLLQKYLNDARQQGVDLETLSPEQLKMIVQMNKPQPPKVYSGQAAVDELNKLFPKKGEVVEFPQKRTFKEEIEAMKKSGDIVDPNNLKKNDNVLQRDMFNNSNLNKEGTIMDRITTASNRIKQIQKEQDEMYRPKTDAEIKAKFDKQNKDSVERLKKKNKDSLPMRLTKNFEKELDVDELLAEGYSKDQAEVLFRAREKMKLGQENSPNEALLRVKEEFADKAGVDVDDFIDIDFELDIPDYAKGGRAGFYTGGITDVEPSLDDIGHGADALNARTRLMSPGAQATTSTGLNYLLAEDNDNMRIPFAGGGDPKRRAFLKLMATLTGGAAAFKSGLLSLGEGGAKKAVTETVKQAAGSGGQVPPYFLNLVKKIKTMGDDASNLATQDRQKVTKFKDYEMTEDISTGNIEILKKERGGFREDVYMSYKVDDVPIKGKKGSTKVEEYEEYTARPDQDGKMKDVEPGVPDEVVQEGTVFEDTLSEFGKAKGGRIGFSAGSLAKLGINSTSRRFLEKVFGKEKFNTMIQNDPRMHRGMLEVVEMFRSKDKEGLKMYLQKFMPNMDDTEIEKFIVGDSGTEGIEGQLIRLGSGREYKNLINMSKEADQIRKLDDFDIEDVSKNAEGGRIGFSGGGIFRAIIARSAAKKGLSVTDFIKATNYKGLPPEVKMYISADDFAKLKGGQQELYENFIDMAKTRKSFQENVEGGMSTPEVAPFFKNLEKTMDEQSFVPKTVTSKDIAEMELMVKNRFNKGRKDNAQGGLQTMLGE